MNQERHRSTDSEPVIDEGFRAWYRTCPCCLGDAFPEVRRALEREELLEAARRAAEA